MPPPGDTDTANHQLHHGRANAAAGHPRDGVLPVEAQSRGEGLVSWWELSITRITRVLQVLLMVVIMVIDNYQ